MYFARKVCGLEFNILVCPAMKLLGLLMQRVQAWMSGHRANGLVWDGTEDIVAAAIDVDEVILYSARAHESRVSAMTEAMQHTWLHPLKP